MGGEETQEQKQIEQVAVPQETADIQQQPQDFIEATFKDKITDPALYGKITDVFTEVRKQLPEDQIRSFLWNKSISMLIRKLNIKEKEDAIQYLVWEIDDQNKNQEEAVVYQEVSATIEKKEGTIDVKKSFQEMKDSYDKLDDKYKNPDKGELAKFEKNIPEETKNFLQSNGLNYNDYVQVAYASTTFKNEPAVKELSDKYTEFNKILHLPDIGPSTTLDAYSNIENVGKDNEDNQSLNDYIANDKNFSKIKQADFWLLSGLTSKFIDKDAKNELQKYQQELAKFDKFFDEEGNLNKNVQPTTLPKEAQKLYQDYTSYQEKIIKEINDKLMDRTSLITKQRICYAPICGLARYFDTSTLQEKNFANNFSLDKADGVKMEGDTLDMRWKISDIDVHFSYDVQKNDSPLKSESILGYNPVDETFVPWMPIDLGVQMPGVEQLTAQANAVTDQNNIAKLLESSSDMSDFEHNLKAQLGDRLMKPFSKEYIVKHRVQKNIERNMATQELQDKFIPEQLMGKLLEDGKINKAEKTSRQAMNIWNASLHHMGLSDIEKMRELTDKTKVLVDKGSFSFLKSPATEKMLQGLKDDENGEWALTFFSWISDPDSKIVNLRDRETLITMWEKDDDLAMNMNKLSWNFEKKLSEAEAQELLENIPGQTQLA